MSDPTTARLLAAFREATGWPDAIALHYATCNWCVPICGHEESTCSEAPEWRAVTEIARRGCALSGHSYDVIAAKPMSGPGRPVSVRCTTCQEHWEIKPKERTPTALVVDTAPPLAPYFDESE